MVTEERPALRSGKGWDGERAASGEPERGLGLWAATGSGIR